MGKKQVDKSSLKPYCSYVSLKDIEAAVRKVFSGNNFYGCIGDGLYRLPGGVITNKKGYIRFFELLNETD